jgi:hypothetical protein
LRRKKIHLKNSLADPDTLLGMLQRGRGAGYLLALETAPEKVWPMLIECITNDPRIDKQVEYRADYYSSLIIETEMDITPLGDYLKQNDGGDDQFWNITLTLETLDSLVCRYNMKALSILQDYVSYGFHWYDVIIYLWISGVEHALDNIDSIICSKLSSDEAFQRDFKNSILEDFEKYRNLDEEERRRMCHNDEGMMVGLFLPVCEPWKTLCQKNEQLAQAFGQFCSFDEIELPTPKKSKAIPDSNYLSVSELLNLVDRPDRPLLYKIFQPLEKKVTQEDEELLLSNLSVKNEDRIIVALKGLAVLGTPKAFEAVKLIIEFTKESHSRVRRHAFEAISQMPASLSLAMAREWFQKSEWYYQVGGGEILVNHAMLDDIPLLVQALKAPQTIGCDDFRLGNTLEALERFEGIGHIPEIENIFLIIPHSYHRRRAALAMASTAPDVFQAQYAYECLWDCHWDTRIVGCYNVALSHPGALARLKEMAENPNESEKVREAAQEAIDEF